MKRYIYTSIVDMFLIDSSLRTDILGAKISKSKRGKGQTTADLIRQLVRVRSSNIWGYSINVKDKNNFGDVIVQFKGKDGGPGDVYMYYDVPVRVYRRWQSAPSKGHYFWVNIRDRYRYSKLTGDKKTKMRGGI